MPDFHVLSEQLRSDLSRVDWAPADDIRAAGTRRRRNQLLAVGAVSAAVVAMVASAALLLPNGRPTSAPVGGPNSSSITATAYPSSPPPTFDPSAIPTDFNPTPGPTASPPAMLSSRLLLTSGDVAPSFGGVDEPFAGPAIPNPFIGCGSDGLPGPQPVGAIGIGFTPPGSGNSIQLGGESVLQYGKTGDAQAVMNGIRQQMGGACAHAFVVDSPKLGGEALLLYSTDGGVVGAQAAHGKAINYEVIRYGAYVVWVTIVDEYQIRDGLSVVQTLAQRAGTRLCAATTC
jgi:hypothetical protein